MSADAPLTLLQERYRAQKGVRVTADVARTMGLTPATLRRFEADRFVSLQALHAITQWVLREEQGETRSRLDTRSRGGGYER